MCGYNNLRDGLETYMRLRIHFMRNLKTYNKHLEFREVLLWNDGTIWVFPTRDGDMRR